MSFAGNLEDLAIVDVIQLLHSTRKSGTLCVKSRIGECQIAFNKGFIISANHHDDSILIGKILVDMETISADELERTLQEQHAAGENRKPLIGMLIERGAIEREKAYQGLETLIEMTIVEMVSWAKGTFTLDVGHIEVSDEYRYIPEEMHQDIHFDTQMVLMDALRTYDEKKRDGMLGDEEISLEAPANEPQETAPSASGEMDLSADLLGLDAIDQMEERIAESFTGLEVFDPSEIHRQLIKENLADIPFDRREELVNFLTDHSTHDLTETETDAASEQHSASALILYSDDELIRHCLMTVCKHQGGLVFATDNSNELSRFIEQVLSRQMTPVLVFDSPPDVTAKEQVTQLRRDIADQHANLCVAQLCSIRDYAFSLQAIRDGIDTVLPRPQVKLRQDSFIEDLIDFLETFQSFLSRCSSRQDCQLSNDMLKSIATLNGLTEPREISLVLLEHASLLFERAITFIVSKDELIAERAIGVVADKSAGVTPPLKFRVPLNEPSIFSRTVETGELFFGSSDDALLKEHLFAEISAPSRSKLLLSPITCRGRTLCITYGDFGQREIPDIAEENLRLLSDLAGMAIENAMYRKQLVKAKQ